MTDAERHARDAEPPRYDPERDLARAEPADPAVAAAPAAPLPTAAPVPMAATNGPLADVIAKPKASSGRGTSLLLALATAIAIGGIAFAAGRLTAPAATASAGRTGNGQFPGGNVPGGALPSGDPGFPGRGGGLGGGISLQGTVTAISADSITLELASGSTMTIPLDADTAFHASSAATAADVTVGSQVTVNPGTRVADPGASLDPNASPGPGAGMSFGPASDVTVVQP